MKHRLRSLSLVCMHQPMLRQEKAAWDPRTKADYAKGRGEGNSTQDHSYSQVQFISFEINNYRKICNIPKFTHAG